MHQRRCSQGESGVAACGGAMSRTGLVSLYIEVFEIDGSVEILRCPSSLSMNYEVFS